MSVKLTVGWSEAPSDRSLLEERQRSAKSITLAVDENLETFPPGWLLPGPATEPADDDEDVAGTPPTWAW